MNQCEHKEAIMQNRTKMKLKKLGTITITMLAAIPLLAQGPPPPSFPPQQLDGLVSRVALYPDPLLAQVLAAATFSDQIPDAARWADQHHYLTGDALARDIQEDQLPWDPSVQALLPFPSVLDMMASDPNWTRDLGDAFLAQNAGRDGRRAADAPPGPRFRLSPNQRTDCRQWRPVYRDRAGEPGGALCALLRSADRVCPAAARLCRGSRELRSASASRIGPAFRPWGWGGNRIVWNSHTVFVNNAEWRRNWVNRATYVHPYTIRRVGPGPAPRVAERHVLEGRTPREKAADRNGGGRKRVEEHGKEEHRDDRR